VTAWGLQQEGNIALHLRGTMMMHLCPNRDEAQVPTLPSSASSEELPKLDRRTVLVAQQQGLKSRLKTTAWIIRNSGGVAMAGSCYRQVESDPCTSTRLQVMAFIYHTMSSLFFPLLHDLTFVHVLRLTLKINCHSSKLRRVFRRAQRLPCQPTV
jgi:hypothetical protein